VDNFERACGLGDGSREGERACVHHATCNATITNDYAIANILTSTSANPYVYIITAICIIYARAQPQESITVSLSHTITRIMANCGISDIAI
jgi:hypothetical protein